MDSKDLQNKESYKDLLEPIYGAEICEVSKASAEIMFDRFCNCKDIDFPFSY